MGYFMLFLRFLPLLLPLLSIYNIQPTLSSPLSNSSMHLCHHQDSVALLQFVRNFVINSSASYLCTSLFGESAYPKIRSWNHNTDCCSWDGVSCNSLSGHVIELDLSCSQIRGTIDSNSTLFQLQTLQSLNLAFNDFNGSTISPKFGQFPHLKHLNLSFTTFSGKVPVEIARLSRLISLDISPNFFYFDYTLEMTDLGLIIKNMTGLKELLLEHVSVSSVMPQSLMNLTSLTSLMLSNCDLRGNFPTDILHLPHLRNFFIQDDLHADFSGFSWTSPLEVLSLHSLHFTGKLPKPAGSTRYLRSLSLTDSNFYGSIPSWVWNVTEQIDLSSNRLSGELPSLLNTNKISKIISIDLQRNRLSGKIPSWVWNVTEEIHLNSNHFSGELPSLLNTNKLPRIKSIYLNQNMLSGKIPLWMFTLPLLEVLHLSKNKFSGQLVIDNYTNTSSSLYYLDLSSNNLSGTIDLNMFHKLKSLSTLILSKNSFSLSSNNIETSTVRHQYRVLGLSSCNLSKFPYFLINQENLRVLELSNNRIHGQVPHWLLVKNTLYTLDISYNYLTGGLENIPWNGLELIDLRSNMFSGLIPQLPPSIMIYLASNNKLTGEIPSSICNLNSLSDLDLSNNSLTGQIPRCLGNLSDFLTVLNLKLNKFYGTLPQDFTKCASLENLDVNGNRLEGPIPTSLRNCLSLQVLDLGNNKLSGKFPHWLGTLPDLQVLLLRSNRFEGPEIEEDYGQTLFPKLRILDIANNQFSGNFPRKLIKSFKAMMNNKDEREKLRYMSEDLIFYDETYVSNYRFSIVLTFKGTNQELDKVWSVTTAIDVSNNKFEGDIPDEIADLVSLRWLNLSFNHFSGTIPPSLGNLVLLESLDFSSNELVGQIPKELENLKSLEFFNVSRNNLAGPIPTGTQFNTFGNESYLENPRLCGLLLSKKCGDDDVNDAVKAPSMEYHDSRDISVWEIVFIGYGSGIVIGLSIGYLVLWGRTPLWLSRLIYRVKSTMEHRSKRRQRRFVR